MALSNWDTFAINIDGSSSNGEFISPKGIKVEIYKNWLYIHDKKAWQKGGDFLKPVIMQITEGNLIYHEITIIAKRGKQNGIYCCVYSSKKNTGYFGIVGIGCYASENSKTVGVKQSTINDLHKWLKRIEKEDFLPNLFLTLDLKKGKRFNQGDMFFIGEKAKTKIGKQKDKTILEELLCKNLRQVKKRKKNEKRNNQTK
jgi:hypothetical protein